MCLIVFCWDQHPKYKLILAANRDEFYERSTQKASFWKDQPHIFGGRDLKAMGTWMGLSKKGRFGAVTNFRDLKNIRADARSRGELVPNFLNDQKTKEEYFARLDEQAGAYNGFNFLGCDSNSMLHYSNYERKLNVVGPGIHGLSNALLDTNWPKVEKVKAQFGTLIGSDFDHSDLLEIMSDTETYPDEILPDTGVPPELERALSAICIRTEKYGTCCSTVLTIDRFGKASFTEKTYGAGDRPDHSINMNFEIENR